jgi:hypothetical protein
MGERITVPPDQELAASVAERTAAGPIANVSRVDVLDSVTPSNFPRSAQDVDGRTVPIEHAVVGVKGREVPRNVEPEVLGNPAARRVDFRL